MKRALRLLVWSLAVIVVVAAGAGVGSWVLAIRARRSAEKLLQDIGSLDPRTATEAQIRSIVQHYGRDDGGYAFDGRCSWGKQTFHFVSIRSTFAWWLDRRMREAHWIVDRPWDVSARFVFDSQGLCKIDYQVVDIMPDRYDAVYATSTYLRPPVPEPFNYTLGPAPPRYPRGFEAQVTSAATPEQKRHAFDVDLSCLTRFGGCNAGCELMPSAWLDYQHKARQEGWPLPQVDTQDPRCKMAGSSP
jgi:hypothetical protein